MESTGSQVALMGLGDEQVIARILSGEMQLFENIVRKYNSRLYRIGMSIVNDSTDVEDIMQAAYIKAYQHLGDFENRAQFGTWLTRIFINECYQYLKGKKVRAMMQTGDHNINRNIAGAITQLPEHALLNGELKKILEQALAQLPDKYRLVFIMREVEDMSIAETMAALDLTASNVKVRLSRAKTMLREKLSRYYKNDLVYQFHLSRCDVMVLRVLGQLVQYHQYNGGNNAN